MKGGSEDTGEGDSNRYGFWEKMQSHQGFGRANFGQRGWLRPAILRLLEDKPMNGMEMINKFYEASHGWWKPSPGSVYPLLETLENEELIRKRSDGRYEVTKRFRSGAESRGQVDEMVTNMEGTVSYLEEMAKNDKTGFTTYRKRLERLKDRLGKL